MTPEPLSGTAQAPSPYTVTRTTAIAAPAERVHALTGMSEGLRIGQALPRAEPVERDREPVHP